MTTDPDSPAGAGATLRPRGSQAFWTVVVALPAAFSLLRLWVEAGGQVQTTLLLVANVSAINLLAAMFITGTRLVTMGLVAVFAIGGILGLSADAAEAAGSPLPRRPLFARWVEAAPLWLLTTTFVLAAATWQILYLPLLVPAFVATFQAIPAYRAQRAPQQLLAATVALLAYAWTVWPMLGDAWRQHEHFALLMFVLPPLLALLVTEPVPAVLARLVATTAQPAVLALLVWAALPVLTTPVLPLTVTTATSADGTPEFIRGHVIGSDDTTTSILQERGGVRYLLNTTITARVLCPSPEELPVYRLRVRDFHIEDSLLEAVGRRVRPVTVTDAACRKAAAPAR
ncbi:MAG TPA: hypothetical protein VFM54_16600 [Micromonosporaceae bacterium]|nr:hypothetical protein [Micromonosporaceae bacterium]